MTRREDPEVVPVGRSAADTASRASAAESPHESHAEGAKGSPSASPAQAGDAGRPATPPSPDAPNGDAAAPAGEANATVAGVTTSEDHEHQLEADLDELAAKAEKADEYLELAKRTKADFENYRKRASREAGLAQERGIAKLAKELLPAIDNLWRPACGWCMPMCWPRSPGWG
jgi:hypothetical protein